MLNEPTFQDYYGQIDRIITEMLNKESAEYLLSVDFDQYLDYLVAQAEWVPLEWDESQKTIEKFSAKVTHGDRYFPSRTYTLDVPKFRLRIPTNTHPQLSDYLRLKPSIRLISGEPGWSFQGNTLVIEVDATEQAVEEALKQVRFWFGGRNKDIQTGNSQLRDRIKPIWEGRRRQLETQHSAAQAVLQKLNIPLHQDPNARAKPVEIKSRSLRTVVARPTPKAKTEPSLVREDVIGLVNFIDQYARQFEVTPRTYSKMKEEELRDLIVGMMNANYPGSSTAETFSKLGKADIRMQVDQGNVLIAECKIWQGASAYVDALDQLFRYLTWRQNYGVLMIFSRRKEMGAAVSEARKAAQSHGSFTAGSLITQSASRFSTRHHHPQDKAKLIEIFNIFVDLSV